MEDAADLYTKSAHAFKMAKKYSCELYDVVIVYCEE